jgi:hypothetical protein
MKGVQEVRRLDDRRLHWRANFFGKTEVTTPAFAAPPSDQPRRRGASAPVGRCGRCDFRAGGLHAARAAPALDGHPPRTP